MKVKTNDIFDISMSILIKCGVPEKHSQEIAETIVYAHTREKHTHGLNRLPIYIRKIQHGKMNPLTPLTIVKDSEAIMRIDANNGFGQVATYYAVQKSIEKAKKYGVGLVGVCKSNNFGAAGFFGELACKENMISVIISNSAPAIAPSGGKKALFGTNPICYAFPGKENIILDMATSVAARGKIRNAAKNNEKIPMDWANDMYGYPTDNPHEALKGTMLPIAGYKGSGLSMSFDILAGLLMGAAFSGNTKGLNDMTDISNYGHFVLTIDIEHFMSLNDYQEKYEYLLKQLKKDNAIYPGELSYKKSLLNQEVVDIPEKQINEINQLLEELNILKKFTRVE